MVELDWGLLKIQHEVFGSSFEQLAKEYNTTVHMIKYAAEEQGWKQLPIAQAARDWQDVGVVDEVTDELMDEVQRRLTILDTVKRAAISPRYHIIEAAILGKVEQIVATMDSTLPTAAAQLKVLTEVVANLSQQTGRSAAAQEEKGSGGITVKILTQVGDNAKQAVQIEAP